MKPFKPPATPPPLDSARGEIARGVTIGLLFFGVLGAWAAFAPMDAGVVAQGVVVVSGNRQTVQHKEGGVVAKLLAREGDTVAKDQVLLELNVNELKAQDESLTQQAAEAAAVASRILAEQAKASSLPRPAEWDFLAGGDVAFDAEGLLARHQAEMDSRTKAQQSQLAVLRERKAQLSARIDGAQIEIQMNDRQGELVGEELRGMRTLLAKGLTPATRVRNLERQQADLIAQRARLTSSIAQAEQGIGEVDMQALALQAERDRVNAETLRDVQTRLGDLIPRLEAIRAQRRAAIIRAPVAGRVVGLSVFTVGGVVRPGDRIMDIVPNDQPMVIEARVRPDDADDLKPGQRTEVRITSLHQRNLPRINGAVRTVSADRFTDERTGEGYFRALIDVPHAEIARLEKARGGEDAALQPGLPVAVVIPLGQRTALDYLLEPLDQAVWRSFREH